MEPDNNQWIIQFLDARASLALDPHPPELKHSDGLSQFVPNSTVRHVASDRRSALSRRPALTCSVSGSKSFLRCKQLTCDNRVKYTRAVVVRREIRTDEVC